LSNRKSFTRIEQQETSMHRFGCLKSLRINAERACKGVAEWPRCGVAGDLVVEERVDCLEMAATRATIDGAPGRD
jgi:hypothetical protein